MSSTLTTVENGVLHLQLNRPKVNAMSSEVLGGMVAAFQQAEEDDAVSAVLVSSTQRCFSAGLDLSEILSLDEEGTGRYVDVLQAAFSGAFSCSKPMACAVQGHAIAGGAILALCADHLVLAPSPARFGVTELAVGVPFPQIAFDAVFQGMPARSARRLMFSSELVSLEEAWELGIGDAQSEEPLEAARAWLQALLRRPQRPVRLLKKQLRAAWERSGQEPIPSREELVEVLRSEQTRAMIQAAMRR